MDLPLLECVPNVSAGRDVVLVDGLGDVVRDGIARGARTDGSHAILADVHRDSDHDRSVFTIVGRGEAVVGGLVALARAAVDRIDLHAGHGVHPRVGVLDVVPVVSLDADAERGRGAAFEAVRRIAGQVGAQLHVPVVRYGLGEGGAPLPGAASTGAVRRGGPGGVMDRVADGELELLAGPQEPHPTAGVTMCGVRDVLVAFNVDLATDDLDLARAVAARVRETAGGDDALPGVRALGLRLPSRDIVQVSTNVERHAECGPARVLESVVRIAAELGATATTAELVGLAPDSALGPLRYACTRHGVVLAAAPRPSIEDAIAQLA
jgi:glutamate formiminotransferase